MRIMNYFPFIVCLLKLFKNQSYWLALFALLDTVLPVQARASSINIQIPYAVGGHVVIPSGGVNCTSNCIIQALNEDIITIFGLPDKGYRFNGWKGACFDTVGPLCTLKPFKNISLSAAFVKAGMPQRPAKALLLLHDQKFKHTVWNEFVKQYFNNRCPVIYGGVVLGKDSHNTSNQVYCYRISFGYYDMLTRSKIGNNLTDDNDNWSTQEKNIKELAYEVKAAVLGLLNLHPDLSLTLVGQDRASVAAQAFLQAGSDESQNVLGLLALQSPRLTNFPQLPEPLFGNGLKSDSPETLDLEATPEQTGIISAALGKLVESWWLLR